MHALNTARENELRSDDSLCTFFITYKLPVPDCVEDLTQSKIIRGTKTERSCIVESS
jgi:hypothetical protein